MDLNLFKCILCQQIPPDRVYKCCQGHLFCCACANSNHYLCTCLEVLTEKENPLLQKLKAIHCVSVKMTKCVYSDCMFNDSIGDVEKHLAECRFRQVKCVGATLKLWNCDFIGRHRDLAEHILQAHDLHHRPFTHYQCASIPFLPEQSYGTMNLIQAHNHDFIFYFYSHPATRQLLFAIYLLGKRKTALRFYYELTIQNKSDKLRQLKITERCFSDEDVALVSGSDYLNPHLPNVIVVTQETVKDFVKDDQIYFQYKLNEIPKKAPEIVPELVKKKVKPIEKPKLKKDPKKTNLKKIESGIPKPPADGPKKSSGDGEDGPGNANPPLILTTTSINKMQPSGSVAKESPCLTPSINKNEKTNAFLFPPREPILQTNHLEAQMYKDPKSAKYFQQLYPTSSISKPTLKK